MKPKNKIAVGLADKGRLTLEIDIETLLLTRLLIQANSGGGKSYLIRLLCEQLFGKVPVIIIDSEGEFSTLREKFGFVLVGKDGETPADLRSAEMVAHKLLELRASAVCDLYEMKPQARHQWVRIFLQALVDAPKELWGPVVIVVDEAQIFAPEGKAGESEASGAMVDLATRGRKRGFCLVAATQRLGKLRKDVAAELLNVMVGMTFIDIDRDRAAECLGVSGAEKKKFNDEIKMVEPGHFWCLGRAICKERTLVRVNPVETTHPEVGKRLGAAVIPPTPASVRAMLPKLADLPKQAEEKAKNEADLRAEIRSLKQQLAQRPKAEPVEPEKVSILTDADRISLNRIIDETPAAFEDLWLKIQKDSGKIIEVLQGIREKLRVSALPQGATPRLSTPCCEDVRRGARENRETAQPESQNGISPVGQRILNAIGELEQMGVQNPAREIVALMAGYTNLTSTGFVKAIGQLRTSEYIVYPDADSITYTHEGRAKSVFPKPRTIEQVHERICQLVGGKATQILKPLIEAYPDALPRIDVAAAANYTNLTSTGYVKVVGRLRKLGFIEYPDSNTMKASKILFLEE